jgi:DNA-binding transcriptional ArsR family regulator
VNVEGPDVATVAALLGDAARARMLTALMSGRALTATELALEGDVAPSTASSHLAKLEAAGLVAQARQGRHRYFRLASAEVAAALEGLMTIAARDEKTSRGAARAPRRRPADESLRRARVCYDHLAGEAGVALLTALRARRYVRASGEALSLTAEGAAWATSLGIDVAALRGRRRPLCRSCLDWSERRFHLAGGLGAALLERLLALAARSPWRRGARARGDVARRDGPDHARRPAPLARAGAAQRIACSGQGAMAETRRASLPTCARACASACAAVGTKPRTRKSRASAPRATGAKRCSRRP